MSESRNSRSSLLTPIGASDVVSTPPPTPASMRPAAMASPTAMIDCRPGATCLLQVVRRGVRAQRAAEHGLAHEVEVAAVLEDRAADDHAELLALQTEAAHQTVERRGEHVLVGRLRVRLVRACERNAVAADDRDGAELRTSHGCGRADAVRRLRLNGLCWSLASPRMVRSPGLTRLFLLASKLLVMNYAEQVHVATAPG